MSHIGRKIRHAREQRNITQEELARSIGVTSRTIIRVENDSSPDIKLSLLKKISSVLGVSKDFFLSDFDASDMTSVDKKMSSVCRQSSEAESILVPILHNISASAGNGALNEGIDDIEFKRFPKDTLREVFGITHNFEDVFIIRSFGDSMSPTLPEGCLLVVQKGSPKEGQICVCRIGGETYVKRFVRLPRIRLLSDNTFYEPIVVDESMDFEAIGIVAGYYRSFLPTQKNL